MTGTSGSLCARRGEDLDARDVRHADVGEHDVGAHLAEPLEAGLSAVRERAA